MKVIILGNYVAHVRTQINKSFQGVVGESVLIGRYDPNYISILCEPQHIVYANSVEAPEYVCNHGYHNGTTVTYLDTNDEIWLYVAVFFLLISFCICFAQKTRRHAWYRRDLLSTEGTCTICLEQIQFGATLECGHVFHEKCINKWSKQGNDCPNCRARLIEE